MKANQQGFTLVEIAIVLVIIGLLLGGVLKGQELINSAKAKSLVNDFRTMSTAVYAYQDRFRFMPGDDPAVVQHVAGTLATTPGTPETQGNGRIGGNWNSTTATDESRLVWQHLRLANLLTGPTVESDPAYLPRNADNGTIGITSTSPITPATGSGPDSRPMTGAFFICSSGITARLARQVDSTMDDGVRHQHRQRARDDRRQWHAVGHIDRLQHRRRGRNRGRSLHGVRGVLTSRFDVGFAAMAAQPLSRRDSA